MSGAGADPASGEAAGGGERDLRNDRVTLVTLAVAATLACGGLAAIAAGYGPAEATSSAPRPALTFTEPIPEPVPSEDLVAPAAYAPRAPGEVSPLRRSDPTYLRIARVGIFTDLMELGLEPDRTLEVPPDTPDAPAGWYRNLASPGENGPAVIVGHLDSPDDKGVFFNLGAVREGDTIEIERRDGSTVTFTVDMVASYARGAFPTAGVYGSTEHPGLRLVTCGGKFAPGAGYEDSVIVFASLTGSDVPLQKSSYSWWR